MKEIKYIQTWCDYLTPCPYEEINPNHIVEGIYVGDYFCHYCKYFKEGDHENHIVICTKE